MDAEHILVAKACLLAAYDGSASFPQIVGRLIAAGFDGYLVDYRCNTQVFYLPDGKGHLLDMPHALGAVAPVFDAPELKGLVSWAQTGPADYSYAAFCEKAKAAGCAGYLVSFPGRRVVYFGRTGETHVEHFPD